MRAGRGSKMKTFGSLVGAVALLLTAYAHAEDASSAAGAKSTTQTRAPLTAIPASHSNADKRIEESISIPTEQLHGFSMAELQRQAAERVAMLSGAIDGDSADAHPSEGGFGDYRIGAGDQLEFTLFNEPVQVGVPGGRALTVRYDGYISLPRVQDVKVAGLTRLQAEEEIKRAYSGIYRNPELSLTIITATSKAYTVTGDVQIPGRYAYTRETSLWDAISLAGGLRARSTDSGTGFVAITGQITKAFVIRGNGEERQVVAYDLRGFGKPGKYDGDVQIYYGDIVYVPEGVNLVYLLGESRSPVIVELTEGMSLLQMLALSGGYNASTAKLNDVVLLRQVDDEMTDIHRLNVRRMLKHKEEDMILQPGDIVYIPQKTMVRLSEFVVRFTNTISPLLGMYNLAVEALFTYDINKETLDALEDSNVSVGTRSPAPAGVTRVPRVISAPNLAPQNLN